MRRTLNWWKRLTSKARRHRCNTPCQRTHRARHLTFELFEHRRLLAVDFSVAPPGERDPAFGDQGITILNSFTPYPKPYTDSQSYYGTGVLLGYGDGSGIERFNHFVEGPSSWFSVVPLDDGRFYLNANDSIARYHADGRFDETFGDRGRVLTPFNVRAIAAQADGKLVAVGDIDPNNGTGRSAAIARFLDDGSLDQTFAGTGWRRMPRFDEGVEIERMTVLSDAEGNVYVAANILLRERREPSNWSIYSTIDLPFKEGFLSDSSDPTSWAPYTRLMIARMNTNGELDTSFGDIGFFSPNEFFHFQEMTLSSSGNLLVSATRLPYNDLPITDRKTQATEVRTEHGLQTIFPITYPPHNPTIQGIMQLRRNGTLDASFGTNGFAATPHVGESRLQVQPDGKLFVVALENVFDNSLSDVRAYRLDSNGQRDSSYGTGGMQLTALDENFRQLTLLPDGSVILHKTGYLYSISRYLRKSIRLNHNLSLDQSYQSPPDFRDVNSSALNRPLAGFLVDDKGKFWNLDSSNSFSSSPSDLRVVVRRFNIDGTPDAGLDSDGVLDGTDRLATDVFHAMVPQADGKLLLAGSNGDQQYGLVGNFALTRLTQDGDLDKTFGVHGRVNHLLEKHNSGIYDVAVQGDGKLVAVGSVVVDATWDFAAVRMLPDGTLDPSFGKNGVAAIDIEGAANFATSVLIQSDGRILVAGYTKTTPNSPRQNRLVRLNPDGSLDQSFGTEGVKKLDGVESRKIALQGDQVILLEEFRENPNSSLATSWSMQRLNRDGSRDMSFGSWGKVDFRPEVPGGSAFLNSLFVDDNRRMIVGGIQTQLGENTSYGLVIRLDETGKLDPTFDGDGRAVVAGAGYLTRLGTTLDGKVLAMASQLVTRLNADGSLDRSFGNQGKIDVVHDGLGSFGITAMTAQPNGDFYLAGSSNRSINFVSRHLARNAAPTAIADDYTLPANGAIFARDVMGSTSAVATDNGILANDPRGSNDRLSLEILQEPRFGSLQVEGDGSFVYIAGPNVEPGQQDSFAYRSRNIFGLLSDSGTVTIQFTDRVAPPKRNTADPFDVNLDGDVGPIDVLTVINSLLRHRGIIDTRDPATHLLEMCDVNGDMFVTPLDILQVINALTRRIRQTVQASGEFDSDVVFSRPADLDDLLPHRKRRTA